MGKIVEYTEQVAAQITAECAGDHACELRVWISVAQQREAMVSELYKLSHIEPRLQAQS